MSDSLLQYQPGSFTNNFILSFASFPFFCLLTQHNLPNLLALAGSIIFKLRIKLKPNKKNSKKIYLKINLKITYFVTFFMRLIIIFFVNNKWIKKKIDEIMDMFVDAKLEDWFDSVYTYILR